MLTALAPLSIDIYTPSLPAVQDDLGGADWLAQASITSCLLGIALGQLVCGPVSDRFGRRPVILVGVVGWTIACVVSAAAVNIVMLVVVRALVGFCGAAGIVVARSIVRDISRDPPEVSSRIALLSTVTAIAPVIAPIIGTGIAAIGGWRADFLALASLGAALSLAFALIVPETAPEGGVERSRGIVSALARGLAERELRLVVLSMLLFGVSFYAYIATAPFIVERELGYTPVLFAVVFTTNAAAMLGANLVFRRAVRRYHPFFPLLVGLSTAVTGGALAFAAAVLSLPDALLWFASTVFVAGAGLVLPGIHSWGQLTVVVSGVASGLTGGAQFLGGVIGSPLVGAIGVSAETLAMVVTVGSLGALVVVWHAGRRRRSP